MTRVCASCGLPVDRADGFFVSGPGKPWRRHHHCPSPAEDAGEEAPDDAPEEEDD